MSRVQCKKAAKIVMAQLSVSAVRSKHGKVVKIAIIPENTLEFTSINIKIISKTKKQWISLHIFHLSPKVFISFSRESVVCSRMRQMARAFTPHIDKTHLYSLRFSRSTLSPLLLCILRHGVIFIIALLAVPVSLFVLSESFRRFIRVTCVWTRKSKR